LQLHPSGLEAVLDERGAASGERGVAYVCVREKDGVNVAARERQRAARCDSLLEVRKKMTKRVDGRSQGRG
jgi:hypothetical protein